MSVILSQTRKSKREDKRKNKLDGVKTQMLSLGLLEKRGQREGKSLSQKDRYRKTQLLEWTTWRALAHLPEKHLQENICCDQGSGSGCISCELTLPMLL